MDRKELLQSQGDPARTSTLIDALLHAGVAIWGNLDKTLCESSDRLADLMCDPDERDAEGLYNVMCDAGYEPIQASNIVFTISGIVIPWKDN